MYTFELTSDDGRCLYIDDSLVVKNDGPPSPTEASGSRYLSEGPHGV